MSEVLAEAAGLVDKTATEFAAVIAKRGEGGGMSWEEMEMALKIADSTARLSIAGALDEIAKHAGSIPKAISAVEQQLKARNRR